MGKSKKTLFVSLLLILSLLFSLRPAASFAATPSMVPVYLLSDKFENALTPNWTVEGGTWGTVMYAGNGAYRQSSLSGAAQSVTGEPSWTNYSFSADVHVEALDSYTTNSVHLMARFSDHDNYYELTYTSSDQTLALRKKEAGTWIVLQSISHPLMKDTEYNLKIQVNDSTIIGYVNGERKLSVTDESFTTGKVGFATFNQSAKFDNAVVAPPSILVYEAEDAELVNAKVDNNKNNGDWQGSGFVDFHAKPGGSLTWTVNVPVAGTYLLQIRYSNDKGTKSERPLMVEVNGNPDPNPLPFPVTANWKTWKRVDRTVALQAGNNTIKLTTTVNEGPNLDNLRLYQGTDAVRATAVTIDYSKDWGEATQLASGFLHGIRKIDPAQKLIDPLTVRTVRGAPYHDLLPSLFDSATYNRVKATGAKIMINAYHGFQFDDGKTKWPGRPVTDRPFTTYEEWEDYVRSLLNEAKEKNVDIHSWITWNEPNIQWKDRMEYYNETHRRAYNVIKNWDPHNKVQAPEYLGYNFEGLKDFLLYCKENNALPDILSWHELSGAPLDIEGHTLELKNWMLENGITPMPMAITEYQGPWELSDINQGYDPGLSVNYIARLERSEQNGLLYALKGNTQWQGDNPDFRAGLDELADSATLSEPTSRWYLYYWYGLATGRKVETIQNKDQVEAFATSDSEEKRSIILMGNPDNTIRYDTPLHLKDIPAYLQNAGKVHIRVESVENTRTKNGKEQKGTNIELEGNYAVTDNALTLALPTMGTDTAYIVKVTPGAAYEYQAESLSQTNSGANYSTVSETPASGGAAAVYEANAVGDWVKYTIHVPSAGTYNLKVLLKKDDDKGISQLYVNGAAMGNTVDEYGPFLYTDEDYGDVTFSQGGDQTLEFRITGKNDSSSSYNLAFDKFTLVTVVDTKPPIITGAATTQPNVNGWYKDNVSVHFTATDSGSGLASVTPDIVLTKEGASLTVTGTAVDKAGNTATASVYGIRIDKTNPVVAIHAAASYKTSDSLTVTYAVYDDLSGVSNVTATLNGQPIANGQVVGLGSMAGRNTLAVTAEDLAGNLTTQSVNFNVSIAASVDLNPGTLNKKSGGGANSMTAYIELPSGYDPSLIQAASIKLYVNGVFVNAQTVPAELGGYNGNKVKDLMVKFNRQKVIAALGSLSGDIKVTVIGSLNDGKKFEATSTIKITE
ncbi:hypothetical protein ASG89_00305 [Paenibacillus sp. Soil766]|uniref:CBM35 domain-containing protein n=1 Tax=Paenibacillus sp. Soil766 TaxID=1736404 RepID=UPI00070C7062|nr:CBM35 domain-containing protein [Paenibacillus sp. Soil766]KRF10029.1 hypothetical protein ASG89_00305 [Paenibacillus sp. Soil766]